MHTLIYEGGSGGHRIEYIEYLFLFLNQNPDLKKDYLFVLNSSLISELHEIIEITKGIKIIELKIDSYINIFKASFKEWGFLKKIIDQFPTLNRIIFMNLDMFQYVILSPGFLKYNLVVNGILFQPYIHLPKNNDFNIKSYKGRLKEIRKRLTIWSLLHVHKNSKIYILNDKDGITNLNKKYKVNSLENFYYLPDPIDDRFLINEDTKSYVSQKYGIEKGRKILLIFGVIDFRKNVERIIHSLGLLAIEKHSKVSLLIAGKIEPSLHDKINLIISQETKKNSGLQIVIKNEFISNQEREILLKASDIILIPYIQFYSSSGVIGHAAKYNKRVLSSSFGVVGKIVEEHSLGIKVNPYSAVDIKNGLENLIDEEHYQDGSNNSFIKEHSYLAFSQTLLGNSHIN